MNPILYSSKTDDWYTPQYLFDALNDEFHFDLDPCADETNHKCDLYYTREQDGLKQDWSGKRAFINPPYGKETALWVKKAHDEVLYGDCLLAVMLLAARTDTKYFHEYIYHKAEIRFLKGRIKFGGSKNAAPFPSMIVIYRKGNKTHA